ncbi:MAG: hypothetical protein P8173_15835 [Gammaproteobacteria bacterium]|jgi:hypothetical protein
MSRQQDHIAASVSAKKPLNPSSSSKEDEKTGGYKKTTNILGAIIVFWITLCLLGIIAGLGDRKQIAAEEIIDATTVIYNKYDDPYQLRHVCNGNATYYYLETGKLNPAGKAAVKRLFEIHTGRRSLRHLLAFKDALIYFAGAGTAGLTWDKLAKPHHFELSRFNRLNRVAVKSAYRKFKKYALVFIGAVAGYPLGYWLGSSALNGCSGSQGVELRLNHIFWKHLATAVRLTEAYQLELLHREFVNVNGLWDDRILKEAKRLGLEPLKVTNEQDREPLLVGKCANVHAHNAVLALRDPPDPSSMDARFSNYVREEARLYSDYGCYYYHEVDSFYQGSDYFTLDYWINKRRKKTSGLPSEGGLFSSLGRELEIDK